MRYALEIPDGLSLLADFDPDAEIQGLEEVPPDERAPVNVVHLSFQVMVGLGFALLGLAAWMGAGLVASSRPAALAAGSFAAPPSPGSLPPSRWSLGGSPPRSADNPGSSTASSAPRTPSTPPPGLVYGFVLVAIVYAVLTVATVYVLRRLAPDPPVPVAPQERDVTDQRSCRRSACHSRRSCSSSCGSA